MTRASAPHVEFIGIGKRFGATAALEGINLTIERGSIHGLVGENGAGKSTLGKILSGVLTADAGEMRVLGKEVSFPSPRHALEHGITTIAQELSLVPARSVTENVFLGIESHVGPYVSRSALRRRYGELVKRSEIEVDADVLVGSLPVAEQQKVEILRAFARNAELILMDEPTARLSSSEAEHLYVMVRALAEAGTTVVFISHLLDEVLSLTDTVTIMRDGGLVRTNPTASETHTSLIEGMIGRRLESNFPEKTFADEDSPEVLRVEGLTRHGVFEDVSFSVRAGEIVVLAGLVGSGRSEVARAIFGADGLDEGSVFISGIPTTVNSPKEAIAAGFAMIPESRKDQGLFLSRPVRENVSLPHLQGLSHMGVVSNPEELGRVQATLESVDVRGATTESLMRSLSGGNQQKALFARWLMTKPAILLADEPTRGVDVGAKRAIYELLTRLASQGSAILAVSSELEEVLGMAHKILVMRGGRLVAELDGLTATEEDIVATAFGAEVGAPSG